MVLEEIAKMTDKELEHVFRMSEGWYNEICMELCRRADKLSDFQSAAEGDKEAVVFDAADKLGLKILGDQVYCAVCEDKSGEGKKSVHLFPSIENANNDARKTWDRLSSKSKLIKHVFVTRTADFEEGSYEIVGFDSYEKNLSDITGRKSGIIVTNSTYSKFVTVRNWDAEDDSFIVIYKHQYDVDDIRTALPGTVAILDDGTIFPTFSIISDDKGEIAALYGVDKGLGARIRRDENGELIPTPGTVFEIEKADGNGINVITPKDWE